ncbi:uncharacterized protein SAPINGB_P005272 [Magnusiomyces paraingens]|uniref:Peptidase M20 dimerisation domain-containing protein n=1 Tax=Magnusiomyces paraingens TaxID=2606893 RepID=A0A5E8C1M7_9ASCO|nr:uncharacterized protein SAPINGB_P005272 [Saprochaete ingens]VVT56785.1 unnamed protein product [Saprochaete ingens]
MKFPTLTLAKALLASSSISTVFDQTNNQLALEHVSPSSLETSFQESCPQVVPIPPQNANLAHFKTPEFRNWSLAVLQSAVQVPSESYDDLGAVGIDPRWNIFYDLENALRKSFPKVHQTLAFERINTHGLLYTWNGTDPSLKPTIFMAHQDVVPVLNDSLGLWTYPPYSAHFDGKFIWGRGTSDDKGSLVAVLEAVETLLNQGIKAPRRTIILSFGYDEEISGSRGAGHISKHLLKRYGPNSIHSIVDEGGSGVVEQQGVKLALPGVTEKGMYDALVVLKTPGGHSSLPPDHTAIGIIGELASLMESRPFSPALNTHSPIYKFLQCTAAYSQEMAEDLRQAIQKCATDEKAMDTVFKVMGRLRATKYMIQTSQAIDIVAGGLKINALPEKVELMANYRIDLQSNVDETRQKVVEDVRQIAEKYGLGLSLNKTLDDGSFEHEVLLEGSVYEPSDTLTNGYFEISDYGSYTKVAPIAPTFDSEAWDTFSGTIRHVFGTFAGPVIDPTKKHQVFDGEPKEPQNIVVSPALMTANTDTKHYWDLTDNIYRFWPYRVLDTQVSHIHTVDERILLDVHIEAVAFYYSYILNL